MKAKMQFLGGLAGDITGSCSLLTVKEGKKSTSILIDIGLIQCGFKDSLEKNKEILNSLKPKDLDYIILTHSHIDHIGRLPLFVKNGFSGRVICTKATDSLLGVMLEDSAKIQMAEASYFNAKAAKAKKAPDCKNNDSRSSLALGKYDKAKQKNYDQKTKNCCVPLYDTSDALAAKELVKNNGYEYHEWIRLSHNISLKFYPSGHVMGGAIVVIRINTSPKDVYLCYSGDLGRRDGIILPPPELVTEPIDYLVLESTYGGKTHPARDKEIEELLSLVNTSFQKNQRMIIPSFALERTQEIIYLLSYYMEQKKIPVVPIYLDSPLGGKITVIFSEGWTAGMFADQSNLKFNPFNPDENPYFKIVTESKESDALIAKTGSYIVIAGSGMCDAGRVRGHLRANLGKTNTTVCLVGYMSENSLGGRLKNHLPIKMNNQEIDVQAKIISFDSFSAHADGPFLVDYAKAVLLNSDSPKNIFIVHGEGESAKNLKTDLENNLSIKNFVIKIPKNNDEEIIQ